VNEGFVRTVDIHCAVTVDFVPGTVRLITVNALTPGTSKRMMIDDSNEKETICSLSKEKTMRMWNLHFHRVFKFFLETSHLCQMCSIKPNECARPGKKNLNRRSEFKS